MYRLLAIAKYDERYVIPPAHAEQAHSLEELATECSASTTTAGPAWAAPGRSARAPAAPTPIAVENFQMLQDRQTSDTIVPPGRQGARGSTCSTGTARARPPGLFPPREPDDGRTRRAETAPMRRAPRATDASRRAWQVASLLLGYPDEELARTSCRSGRPRPSRCRPGGRRRCGGSSTTLASDAARRSWRRHYVETFDHRRRCCLYLTYFAHGDTRKRGMALLRFKQTYRAAGLELGRRRAARPPVRRARVRRHRPTATRAAAAARPPGRAGAAAAGAGATPARPGPTCCEAVTATLPPLRGDEREAVRRLAAQGPPDEEVGLAPFAPPERCRCRCPSRPPTVRPHRAARR